MLQKQSFEEAKKYSQEQKERAEKLKLWHPSKVWIILNMGDYFLPCTACSKMETIRKCKNYKDKFKWWSEILRLSIETMRKFEIGLDINPTNFAVCNKDQKLYYLDDEVYGKPTLKDIAEAIIQRIPEEKELDKLQWLEFGVYLRTHLADLLTSIADWRDIWEGISDYPLGNNFYQQREFLLSGLGKN